MFYCDVFQFAADDLPRNVRFWQAGANILGAYPPIAAGGAPFHNSVRRKIALEHVQGIA